jgi:hypothetical protein
MVDCQVMVIYGDLYLLDRYAASFAEVRYLVSPPRPEIARVT